MIRRSITAFATAVFVAWPGSVSASPYKITGLKAATSFELKLFTKLKSTSMASELEGPGFDLTFPIVPGLEASFTSGSGRLHEAGRTRWGMIDSEVAMKWEIVLMPEDGRIGITTEPALIAPTGTNGLGDDEWAFEAPLVVGWGHGPVEIRGELGYERGFTWEFAPSVELQGRLGRSLRRDDHRPQTEAAMYIEIAF